MSADKDATSASRKTLILAGLVLFIAAGGGFVLWSWLLAPPPAASNVSISRVTAASSHEAAESPEYRSLLREANERGAQQARARDESFIASIPMGQDVPVDVITPEPLPEPAPAESRTTRRQTARQENQDTALSDNQKAALQQLVGQIRQRNNGTGMVQAVALQSRDPGASGMRASLQATPPAGARRDVPDVEIVPPYTRIAGVVATAVDSDIQDAPVLVYIPSGRYAGAVLQADRAPLAGDGVNITLTRMAWKGVTYQVSARALQDETLLPSVASNVNNRYFSRIILPGIAGMATEVGSLYANSGTRILSNGTTTMEGRTGTPDTAAVLGVMAGGMGKEAGNVIRQDASRLPVRQVTVTHGEVVAVQFLGGVYSSDDIRQTAAQRPPASLSASRLAEETQPLQQQAQDRVNRRLRQEDL
ncbi:TPA: conjugal transfer protein TraO [Klebsiella oxytoca]|nr:conjugal transfer protein TraO [Klebsiella oxytoca]HBM3049408.1 conjugal transfer protein TraO [Klebsiella oxytoca]HEC2166198.1 conjugal transfer protein TraO [Klebsiella oxytoca]